MTSLWGCQKPEPAPSSISEAQKQLERKCHEDFDLHVLTHMIGHTLWIYLPTKEPLFDYEAQKENSGEAIDRNKPAKFAVQYIDGNFSESKFFFEYDIVDRRKSKKDEYGYNSSYTDNYIKMQNNLFTAVSDVFFNAEAKKGEIQPHFFVIVITDIKKGIETQGIFYLEDFERYMTGDLPYEEYSKRFLADSKGGQSLIGDETGTHLQYKDITMEEFLTKQVINRINFKFQRSDFQPPDDYDDTIISIFADTIRYYNFEKFSTLQLFNLRQNKKYLFEKNQLASFGEEAKTTPTDGKLIRIRFENGQAEFNEN